MARRGAWLLCPTPGGVFNRDRSQIALIQRAENPTIGTSCRRLPDTIGLSGCFYNAGVLMALLARDRSRCKSTSLTEEDQEAIVTVDERVQ